MTASSAARLAALLLIIAPCAAHNVSVVLIVTDDQDLTLGSMHAMPNVRERIASRGTTLNNFFANSPICVPSRITLMSGRFIHNMGCPTFYGNNWNAGADHKAPQNSYYDLTRFADPWHVQNGSCYSAQENYTSGDWFNLTVARRMQAQGLRTGAFGKVFNKMPGTCDEWRRRPPPYWDVWHVFCKTDFYNYEVNIDGELRWEGLLFYSLSHLLASALFGGVALCALLLCALACAGTSSLRGRRNHSRVHFNKETSTEVALCTEETQAEETKTGDALCTEETKTENALSGMPPADDPTTAGELAADDPTPANPVRAAETYARTTVSRLSRANWSSLANFGFFGVAGATGAVLVHGVFTDVVPWLSVAERAKLASANDPVDAGWRKLADVLVVILALFFSLACAWVVHRARADEHARRPYENEGRLAKRVTERVMASPRIARRACGCALCAWLLVVAAAVLGLILSLAHRFYLASTWRPAHYGHVYSTAALGNATLAFVEESLDVHDQPFFAYFAPWAPHTMATPAPWHLDAHLPSAGANAHRTASFDRPVSVSDARHAEVTELPRFSECELRAIDDEQHARLRSLMSVDDTVGELIDALEARGALESTVLIFTSDHGYSLGQFGVPSWKAQVYDHNLRVPFYIAGPGIVAHTSGASRELAAVASMVDLLPTLLELVGARARDVSPDDRTLDGRSFAPVLRGDDEHSVPPRDVALIQQQSVYTRRGGIGRTGVPSGWDTVLHGCVHVYNDDSLVDGRGNTFVALRVVNASHDFVFAEFTDVIDDFDFARAKAGDYTGEYYDMRVDPDQLTNRFGTLSDGTRAALHAALHGYRACAGNAAGANGTCSRRWL